MSDQEIEKMIQDKGLTAARITPSMIEERIEFEYYFNAEQGVRHELLDGVANGVLSKNPPIHPSLQQVTICTLILKNGTKVVGVNTGPVSPSNFDAEIAKKLAREQAIDQVWPMLGYELRTKLAGG